MLDTQNLRKKNGEFLIHLDNYEGPIDLLLDLAKRQKVDLSEISVLKLSEQYIDFIKHYQDIHLEVAADYLVMAAWLTYLKSRLLLPKEDKDDLHTPEELEEALKYQLKRLDFFQNISKKLYSMPFIGRDVFYGGSAEGVKIKYKITYTSNLYDILKSYSNILNKNRKVSNLTITFSELYSVDAAIKRLKNIFGSINEWTNLINLIPKLNSNRIINKSIISSNFVASLELVKNNYVEIKQETTFGNIFLKNKNAK